MKHAGLLLQCTVFKARAYRPLILGLVDAASGVRQFEHNINISA